jgi:hypothetical protein
MDREYSERNASLQVEWIKSKESGISYLCRAGFIRDKENAMAVQSGAFCTILTVICSLGHSSLAIAVSNR